MAPFSYAASNAATPKSNINKTVESKAVIITTPSSHIKIIGISQIVEHPALDAVRLGMLSELARAGFQVGENLIVNYENAQGSMVTSTQIANKLLSSPMDVGVAISTPSAQTLFFTALKQDKQIPIVFSAVSDPVVAKLESTKKLSYPITGVTDSPNLEGLLELMKQMMPELKTLGLMYNPSEVNSVATIKRLKQLLAEKGIRIQEVTVTKTAEVAQATQSLMGKVDALYFPQDNTIVAAIETVVRITHQTPEQSSILPIFCSDPALVPKGVLAAFGFDYTEVGIETGKVVAKILNGEKTNEIPVHSPAHFSIVINRPLVEKLKLVLPQSVEQANISFVD